MHRPKGQQTNASRGFPRNRSLWLRVLLADGRSHLHQRGHQQPHSGRVQAGECALVRGVGPELRPEREHTEDQHHTRAEEPEPTHNSSADACPHGAKRLMPCGRPQEGCEVEQGPRHCLCQRQAGEEHGGVDPTSGHNLFLEEREHDLATAPDHRAGPPEGEEPEKLLVAFVVQNAGADEARRENQENEGDQAGSHPRPDAEVLDAVGCLFGSNRGHLGIQGSPPYKHEDTSCDDQRGEDPHPTAAVALGRCDELARKVQ
mmetsp:Transcript_109226/g.352530  ORF Transcript_109226/g.352530 Transcript_109226/m.352530 type:complete len:260 (+) Transcript_109226:859-1638(+)